MPLNPASLASDLVDLYNFVNAATSPIPADTLAQKWTDAFANYLAAATNPAFPPPAIVAGKAAMKTILAATILSPPPAGLVALTAGLMAFCVTAGGLATPFVVAPPPSPLPPPPPVPAPSTVAALAMAGTIHSWAITGQASVPPAPPAPWA
jgi:hypothetical protein